MKMVSVLGRQYAKRQDNSVPNGFDLNFSFSFLSFYQSSGKPGQGQAQGTTKLDRTFGTMGQVGGKGEGEKNSSVGSLETRVATAGCFGNRWQARLARVESGP